MAYWPTISNRGEAESKGGKLYPTDALLYSVFPRSPWMGMQTAHLTAMRVCDL